MYVLCGTKVRLCQGSIVSLTKIDLNDTFHERLLLYAASYGFGSRQIQGSHGFSLLYRTRQILGDYGASLLDRIRYIPEGHGACILYREKQIPADYGGSPLC